MRLGLLQKDKAEKIFIAVHNNESTDMQVGASCIFAINGTEDGNLVQHPSTGSVVHSNAFMAGIIASTHSLSSGVGLESKGYGMAQVFGFCEKTVIVRQGRAASTDSFSSAPAVALGDVLQLVSTNNGLSRSASGLGLTTQFAFAVAAETLASLASSASTTSETRTAVTTTLKTFLRIM